MNESNKNDASTNDGIGKIPQSKSLSRMQKIIFSMFPGIPFIYGLFSPGLTEQKKLELELCINIGIRNILFLCLISGLFLFFALDKNEISTDNKVELIITCILIFVFFIFMFRSASKLKNKLNSRLNR